MHLPGLETSHSTCEEAVVDPDEAEEDELPPVLVHDPALHVPPGQSASSSQRFESDELQAMSAARTLAAMTVFMVNPSVRETSSRSVIGEGHECARSDEE